LINGALQEENWNRLLTFTPNKEGIVPPKIFEECKKKKGFDSQ